MPFDSAGAGRQLNSGWMASEETSVQCACVNALLQRLRSLHSSSSDNDRCLHALISDPDRCILIPAIPIAVCSCQRSPSLQLCPQRFRPAALGFTQRFRSLHFGLLSDFDRCIPLRFRSLQFTLQFTCTTSSAQAQAETLLQHSLICVAMDALAFSSHLCSKRSTFSCSFEYTSILFRELFICYSLRSF